MEVASMERMEFACHAPLNLDSGHAPELFDSRLKVENTPDVIGPLENTW
jgi:hypothetical protein